GRALGAEPPPLSGLHRGGRLAHRRDDRHPPLGAQTQHHAVARSQASPAASTASSRGATNWRSPIASPAQPMTLNGRRNAVSGRRTSSSSQSTGGRSTPSTGAT